MADIEQGNDGRNPTVTMITAIYGKRPKSCDRFSDEVLPSFGTHGRSARGQYLCLPYLCPRKRPTDVLRAVKSAFYPYGKILKRGNTTAKTS